MNRILPFAYILLPARRFSNSLLQVWRNKSYVSTLKSRLDMNPRSVLFAVPASVALTFAVVRGPAMAADPNSDGPASVDVEWSAKVSRALLSRNNGGALQGAKLHVANSAADTIPLYTAAQLDSGTALYKKVCSDCHEDADYTNKKFRDKWNGKTLYDFYYYVSTKMPDDNPGGLTKDEYANSMAYILKLNGVPAGPNAIAPDSALMSMAVLNFVPVDSMPKVDSLKAKVDTLVAKLDTLKAKVDTLKAKVDTMKVDTIKVDTSKVDTSGVTLL